MERHQRLVDSKPFSDYICAVEAYIIPHENKITKLLSLAGIRYLEGGQECLEMLGVVWTDIGNVCSHTFHG